MRELPTHDGVTHDGGVFEPRDFKLEAHLMDIAARAAGFTKPDPENPLKVTGDDAGLSALADSRTWPGGIRPDLDALQEGREESADFRNYMLMGITLIWPLVVAGEPEALDLYSRLMGALSATVTQWHRLQHVPS